MDPSDAHLQALVQCLQLTLDPRTIKHAEKELRGVESNPGYPLLLMRAMTDERVDPALRQQAAITFKNFIKRSWDPDGETDTGGPPAIISPGDREAIKQKVVELMLRLPESMQKQLSETIAIIGKSDFPDKWPNLLPDMVAHFATGDFNIINGVLRTAHPLFRRYRYEGASNELWSEIKLVLTQFAEPLTMLLKATVPLLETHKANAPVLKVLYSSIMYMCELFFSLNVQELPEYFEDHMDEWMSVFHGLLSTPSNPLIDSDDPERPGVLEKVKSVVCEIIALYASKYDEDFSKHMPTFVTCIWSLLTTTTADVKFDVLVCTAMGFLSSVAERPTYRELFSTPGTLDQVCLNVVMPNITLRQSDEEMFEDDADEYILRDIEGSDVDTRRRGACDLIRALCSQFEAEVTGICSQFIIQLLKEYMAAPAQNWKQKDTAIFLVTSLAVKGKTANQGTTQTNELVDIGSFFQQHVLPEFKTGDVDANAIVKADALKFVVTFRNQLPPPIHHELLPVYNAHLASKYAVIVSYAAHCLERSLMVRAGGAMIFTPEHVGPALPTLLQSLFSAFAKPGCQENEYVMKAIMRCISTAKVAVKPFAGVIAKQLGGMLFGFSRAPECIPAKPFFNHFLFETFGCTIRFGCPGDLALVQTFEESLMPSFENLLKFDITEYQPYVFQLLAQLLELRSRPVPQTYMMLFPHLMAPVLWESGANTEPLSRLLQAYVTVGGETVFADKSLFESYLGVFQKLIAQRRWDHEGFALLGALTTSVPLAHMQPFLVTIVRVLLTRLQAANTPKYMSGLLQYSCLFMGLHGAPLYVQTVDSIQDQLFAMLLNRLLENVQKVSGSLERKVCAIGMIKLLTETPAMLTTYQSMWARLLEAILKLFELPEEDADEEDEGPSETIPGAGGYQASHVKLASACKADTDHFAAVDNPKLFLVKQLVALGQQKPGQIMPMVLQGVSQQAQGVFQQYLAAAGVAAVP
eukprot:m.183859 g.183859  ORF g.183859 m.183859 type:complete len:978 (+) comp18088_c0_seq1:151-3084(+)